MTYEQRKAKAFELRQHKPVITSESLDSKNAPNYVFKNLHLIGDLCSIEHTVYPEFADYFTRFIGSKADLVINSGLGSGYNGEGPRAFRHVLITLGLHPERVHDFVNTPYPPVGSASSSFTRVLTHTMSEALLQLLHKSTRLSRQVYMSNHQIQTNLKSERYALIISPYLQNAFTYKFVDIETGSFIIVQYEKGNTFQRPVTVAQHGFMFNVTHLPKTAYEDAVKAMRSGIFFHVMRETHTIETMYKNAQ